MRAVVYGSFRLLILFDVADAIRLKELRALMGETVAERVTSFARPAPDYVRFERPPVVESVEGGQLRYYDYGVVSVEMDSPFELEWPQLVTESSRWIADPAAESRAMALLRPRLDRAAKALVNPYSQWLSEDYYVIALRDGGSNAAELLSAHGHEIAQIVRGESLTLSAAEQQEVLQARLSYYPTDLLVVGWSAAFVCDSPGSIEPTIQLLEYANTQLLEYRHYDELLTRVLEGVYASLERGTGFLRRWRMAREAARLNTIRLDVTELAERTDNSIKFLSDMFYARLYRLAAARVGVPDYRNLVESKLRIAGELYQFMVDQFQQARAFVLELLVVIILVIELIFLFRGKP